VGVVTVIYLPTCTGNDARLLADDLDRESVTHAVMAYRTIDGDVRYHAVGMEDLTYLIGMLERVQMHMHCKDSYVLPDP
jgi:hypothetical protein